MADRRAAVDFLAGRGGKIALGVLGAVVAIVIVVGSFGGSSKPAGLADASSRAADSTPPPAAAATPPSALSGSASGPGSASGSPSPAGSPSPGGARPGLPYSAALAEASGTGSGFVLDATTSSGTHGAGTAGSGTFGEDALAPAAADGPTQASGSVYYDNCTAAQDAGVTPPVPRRPRLPGRPRRGRRRHRLRSHVVDDDVDVGLVGTGGLKRPGAGHRVGIDLLRELHGGPQRRRHQPASRRPRLPGRPRRGPRRHRLPDPAVDVDEVDGGVDVDGAATAGGAPHDPGHHTHSRRLRPTATQHGSEPGLSREPGVAGHRVGLPAPIARPGTCPHDRPGTRPHDRPGARELTVCRRRASSDEQCTMCADRAARRPYDGAPRVGGSDVPFSGEPGPVGNR